MTTHITLSCVANGSYSKLHTLASFPVFHHSLCASISCGGGMGMRLYMSYREERRAISGVLSVFFLFYCFTYTLTYTHTHTHKHTQYNTTLRRLEWAFNDYATYNSDIAAVQTDVRCSTSFFVSYLIPKLHVLLSLFQFPFHLCSILKFLDWLSVKSLK